MKKIICLLIFSAILHTLDAQVKFGVNIGLPVSYSTIKNHFTAYDTSTDKFGSKLGVKIGAFATFKIMNNWKIVSGISFVHKGAVYHFDSVVQGNTESLALRINTGYIEIEPLTLTYKTKKMHGFFVGAGPVMGIGIKGKAKVRYPGKLSARDAGPERNIQFDWKKNGVNYKDSTFYLKPLEIGAAINLGYEIKKTGISFLLSFYQAFSNISPDKKGLYRNRYLLIGARFRFGG